MMQISQEQFIVLKKIKKYILKRFQLPQSVNDLSTFSSLWYIYYRLYSCVNALNLFRELMHLLICVLLIMNLVTVSTLADQILRRKPSL